MKHKVTMQDVAQRAGVSATTVSMILNGKNDGKFSEKTCRSVIDACNELGYVKSMAFKPDGVNDKVLIAITPTLTNLYYVHMIEAMEYRAKQLGYSLLVFNTFREITQETQIIQICNQLPFVGILFLYPPENNMLLAQMEQSKHIVYIYDKGTHDHADILELDGWRMGSIIGEYMIQLGHERIAFLTSTFQTKQVTRIRRLEGLQEAYRAHGLNPERSIKVCSPADLELTNVKSATEGYELGYFLVKQMMEAQEDVSAFVALNDMIAFGALDAILDAGKRVPEDYSVCGCDNTFVSRLKRISLTSVESYSQQTGKEAINILVRKIEGGDQLAKSDDSPNIVTRVEYIPKLIVRESTGVKGKKTMS